MILIPNITNNNPKNTSILKPFDESKKTLDIKYIKITLNETINATKVTSGESFIECIKVIENK